MTDKADKPAPKKARKAPPLTPPGMHKPNKMRLANSGITTEQEAYCRGRAMGMSIAEAVTAAGSTITAATARNWEGSGHHRNQKVVDRINELSAIASQNAILKSGLDREWVISRYMKVVDRCMQAEPVFDKQGEPTGEYKFDASGANTALRALGDTLGLFKPADKKPEDDYAHLTDEDLTRIATELANQTGLAAHLAGASAPGLIQQVVELQAIRQAK